MLARRVTILAVTLLALSAQAQSPPPAFEVASVKANKSTDPRPFGPQLSGDRFRATNFTLPLLIGFAWDIPFQGPALEGVSDWIRSERFDIDARAGAGAFPPGLSPRAREEQLRLMLQALLADRFKLVLRRESKELPVYAIVVAKNGPQLEKAKIEEKDCPEDSLEYGVTCHSFSGGRGRGLHGQAVGISDLARFVENWSERPVIDKTGMKGLFHIETSGWQSVTPGPQPAPGAKAEDGSNAADVPTLFDVFARLGLKLKSQKAHVDVYRVEYVERPSEN